MNTCYYDPGGRAFVPNLTDSYYRDILDAMPVPVFVVDGDVRIELANRAALEAFGLNGEVIQTLRGGEALHCLHSTDAPEGCGRGPHCRNCLIRNLVGNALRGRGTVRRRMKYARRAGSAKEELELLITANPLPASKELAILVVEDISEISTLHDILPICANCKKIRDDQQYWQKVEHYFHDYIGVDFSHGLCPGCAKELYPDIVV